VDRKAELAKIFQDVGFDGMQAGCAYPADACMAGFAAGARKFLFVVVHRPLHRPYSIGLGVSRRPRKRFNSGNDGGAVSYLF
jgi:hypothetical protein